MNFTLSKKQKEYWNNAHHRWGIKTGATRAGKTYMDYFLIPKRLLAVEGKEGLNVILGNTRETIRRNILLPMQNMYGAEYVGNLRADNSVEMFGQRVFCLGADNVNHVNRLRGASIKYCYGDEITTWHPDVFEMLKSRLDKPYSVFDGTCNPADPQHWFKEFLDSDADIFQQAYTIDDNPYLDKSFVENLKKEYSGTVLYDRYILGMWVASEGALFTTYPEYTEDESLLYDGIAHIDAAYGGSDGTAFTCAKKTVTEDGVKIYMFGKLRNQHIDTLMDVFMDDMSRLRCSPVYMERNADKGFVGREFHRKGQLVRLYDEHENKFKKIATFLRKWWPSIVFLKGTDKRYIEQIMAYNEGAEHDDAPDSAACICRVLDNKSGVPYQSPLFNGRM